MPLQQQTPIAAKHLVQQYPKLVDRIAGRLLRLLLSSRQFAGRPTTIAIPESMCNRLFECNRLPSVRPTIAGRRKRLSTGTVRNRIAAVLSGLL